MGGRLRGGQLRTCTMLGLRHSFSTDISVRKSASTFSPDRNTYSQGTTSKHSCCCSTTAELLVAHAVPNSSQLSREMVRPGSE